MRHFGPMRDPPGTSNARTGLVRTLGRWDLAAISMNTIVGSGIFLLPATAAAAVGAWAPLAFLVSGLLSLLFAMAFAEASGRVAGTGGPYLIARAAFGDFVGFEVGWIFWLSRLAAVAASYNVFLAYLAGFVPAAGGFPVRAAVITAAVALVTWLNIRGVRTGATLTNAFTVAKLAPLVLLVIAGAAFIALQGAPTPAPAPDGDFWRAVLLVAFAFGGFEVATVPGGEARSPARDIPAALFMSITGAICLYVALQFVCFAIVPGLGASARPLGDAAAAIAGAPGATLIAVGVLLSTAGYVFGAGLVVPRIAFALAYGGQFPAALARIHPTFRTPWVAIVTHGVITWALALGLTFFSLVVVNVLARLVVIGVTCAAVLHFRRRRQSTEGYLAPGGWAVPVAGLLAVGVLLTQAQSHELLWGCGALLAGSLLYAVFNRPQLRRAGG
ncbi:MAG: APC family permease [Gammaproteobacteria bacterium]|nr:APC family permease [Gammaproteobacteria bacterium]